MKMPTILSIAVIAAAASISSDTAWAHAFILEQEVDAGAYHVVQIGIAHGCDGTPTHTVRVKIPEGISLVRPQPIPGWKLSVTLRKSEHPYVTSEGVRLTEVPDEITWSGGHLLDTEFEYFRFVVKLPSTPNVTLFFKTIQQCEKGEYRWIEEHGEAGAPPKQPAPFINLISPKPQVRPFAQETKPQ